MTSWVKQMRSRRLSAMVSRARPRSASSPVPSVRPERRSRSPPAMPLAMRASCLAGFRMTVWAKKCAARRARPRARPRSQISRFRAASREPKTARPGSSRRACSRFGEGISSVETTSREEGPPGSPAVRASSGQTAKTTPWSSKRQARAPLGIRIFSNMRLNQERRRARAQTPRTLPAASVIGRARTIPVGFWGSPVWKSPKAVCFEARASRIQGWSA